MKSYTGHVRAWLRWCEQTGRPAELTRELVQAHIAGMLTSGSEPNTARLLVLLPARSAPAGWPTTQIDADPLLGLRPPKLTTKVTESLTDDQLRLLLKACQGKSLRDRRDEAIVRLMLELVYAQAKSSPCRPPTWTCRAGWSRCGAVRAARAASSRSAPPPPPPWTATSRPPHPPLRRRHRPVGWGGAARDWVITGSGHAAGSGPRGRYRRLSPAPAAAHLGDPVAGARGGHQGLMAVAGWSTAIMLDRYTGASTAERAIAEARSLGLGEL